MTAIAVSGAVLLAAAAPVYGVPEVDDPVQVVAGVRGRLGRCSSASGVLLGTLLPSARAAQAVGLMLFFPSFLLGVGGPPPAVMSEPLREIADKLPLAMVNDVVRQGWLGLGNATGTLATVGLIAIVAAALAARRTAL